MDISTVVFIVGIALAVLVAVQLVLVVVQSAQGLVWARQRHRGSLRLLDERVEAAKALRVRNEKERFAWNGFRKFVIDRKVHEADGICSFYLVPHDRKPLPSYKPGQFLTFSLHLPGHDKPVVRCYSLSDAPNEEYFRVTIKRLPPPPGVSDAPPGLVSNFFHEHCHENEILDVKAPGGNFVLDPLKRKPAVLIGGGVGVTPFLSMINAVVESGSSREVWLFYGVRHGGELVTKNHLRDLSHRVENIHVVICFSAPREDDLLGQDFDHEGHVSVDLLKQYFDSNNQEYYMCGPPGMMKAITTQLAAWGVPKADIRTEAFGPASVKAKQAAAPKEPAVFTTKKFTVKFAKCQKKLQWDGRADNLLEFGEAGGVPLDGGCRAGNCGTCEVALVSGEIAYNQEPEFPDLKEGCCLTCIGVPKGDIVIDA
jgi:ferredoxin-NADP reductase